MTITARNRFFFISTIFSIISTMVFMILTITILFNTDKINYFSEFPDESNTIYTNFWIISPYLASIVRLVFNMAGLLCVLLLITTFFRKTTSAEIFFFFIFAFSLITELARIYVPVFSSSSIPNVAIVTFITRICLFGRICGVLSLFISSLYAAGFQYEKLGRMLILIIMISIGCSGIMPINTNNNLLSFGYSFGYYKDFLFVIFIIEAISIINFILAVQIQGTKVYWFVTLGAILVIIGREALALTVNPLITSIGFICFICGSILFIRKIHSYYLWF